MLKFVVLIVIIQLFYGSGVTLLAYSMPDDVQTVVSAYQQPSSNLNLEGISTSIEENIQSQLNIPIIDIGTLIFFSGNILLDLVVNFFTAIPSMITIAFTAFFTFFPVQAYIAAQIKLLFWVFAAILYFIAFINMILNIRSSQGTGVI